jgi:type IV secretory pathway TrbD component
MPAVVGPGAHGLNKPLLIIGIDRKLAGLNFLTAVIVGPNDGFVPKLSAFALFIAVWGNRPVAQTNIFLVMNQVRQRKSLYDPLKRDPIRLLMARRPE